MSNFQIGLFGALLGICVVSLWHIAWNLGAIREILADIEKATRATAEATVGGRPSVLSDGLSETNRLLKLAIKKQWGSAVGVE